MYLLDRQQIEDMVVGLMANGACCSSPSGPAYATLQSAARTRIEEAMNIEHLLRGVWVDHFHIPRASANRAVVLRLSNAFIDNRQSVVIGVSGEDEPVEPLRVDTRLGLVYASLPAGAASVKYTSGFPLESTDTLKFAHTPEWMQTIALAAIRQWVLATASGAQPKDVSLGGLTAAIKHEIATRVYNRYDRPRAGVLWPQGSLEPVDEAPATFNELEARAW